jgi:hypothetical protein
MAIFNSYFDITRGNTQLSFPTFPNLAILIAAAATVFWGSCHVAMTDPMTDPLSISILSLSGDRVIKFRAPSSSVATYGVAVMVVTHHHDMTHGKNR